MIADLFLQDAVGGEKPNGAFDPFAFEVLTPHREWQSRRRTPEVKLSRPDSDVPLSFRCLARVHGDHPIGDSKPGKHAYQCVECIS